MQKVIEEFKKTSADRIQLLQKDMEVIKTNAAQKSRNNNWMATGALAFEVAILQAETQGLASALNLLNQLETREAQRIHKEAQQGANIPDLKGTPEEASESATECEWSAD